MKYGFALVTPFPTFPHGGRIGFPFPLASLRHSGFAKAKGENERG